MLSFHALSQLSEYPVVNVLADGASANWGNVMPQLLALGAGAGKRILAAVVLFIVGRYVVKLLNHMVARLLRRDSIDPSVQTFLRSLVKILLTLLLVVSVIGALGVNTTSFAALLASAGVAVGMALSGNLQNFAGGIVILLFKPYRVGDWIETSDYSGTVKEIQIFHTILQTADLRMVYAPNGVMSTTAIVNVNRGGLRRELWTVSIAYGNDVERARQLLLDCLKAEPRILLAPTNEQGEPLEPYYVGVAAMSASSVDLTVRAYVEAADYWPVCHQMNEIFYQALTADEQLNIPFPTQTVHLVREEA